MFGRRPKSQEKTFIVRDRGFGAKIPAAEYARLLKLGRQKWPRETGGILVGVYSDDKKWALVRRVVGPGRASKHARFEFERSAAGINGLLRRLWRARAGRLYYLGEWHTHPQGEATPSQHRDDVTMLEIARSPKVHCPEPLLLVVGGEIETSPELSMSVYTRKGEVLSMAEVTNAEQ